MSGASKIRAIRDKLWEKSHICGICNKEIRDYANATLDHVIPKHYGGRTWIGNSQLAHKKCNHSRNHSMTHYSSGQAGRKKDERTNK